MSSSFGPLVSAAWLQDNLMNAPDVRVFDASWYLPAMQRDAVQEFEGARIPGAQFFDFDGQICDPNTDLPHMLPSAEQFGEQLRALGLSQGDRVVVYDGLGVFGAARAWWMLRAMGHEQVAVLQGGFNAWQGETESGPAAPPPSGNFQAQRQNHLIADTNQVLAALEAGQTVVDARPADRFEGRAPEPRPGLRMGHMPGAKNLPFSQVTQADISGFLTGEDLRTAGGLLLTDDTGPLIASCGSGVTASTLALAAAVLGRWDVAVYDGAWAEWGARDDLPVTI